MIPPSAERRAHVLSIHGDDRPDPWYWLRNREDPSVIAHLEAENAYTEQVMAPTSALQERLFEEIKSRIKETDLSAPVPHGGWWYYTRTVEGLQYAIHCRSATEPPPGGAGGLSERSERAPRPKGEAAPDELVLVDENALAEGHEFFALRARVVSPDHRLLAYTTNTDGSDNDDIHVRDLHGGEDLPDVIERVTSNIVWASDNRTLFYVHRDEALRPFRLFRHLLGTPASDDVLVMEEPDERFRLSISRSKSGRVLVVTLGSATSSESWVLEADDPAGAFRLVEARRPGVEYRLTHHGERFFIVTNDGGAENFALLSAPVASPGRAAWTPVLPYDETVRLYGVEAFAGHLVLYERAHAVRRIRVMEIDARRLHEIEQPESVSTAVGGANPEFETSILRYGYTSLVTPSTVFDYDMTTGARTVRKQEEVLGGFDPARYETIREWAGAPDGVKVPISIVRRVDTPQDGTAPAVIYGYGSYESSTDPAFSSIRLSLLDRGFVYAIAHVRGGGEMGRRWYEDGKFLHKRNTFGDFIACAEHLVARRYSSPEHLVAMGGSAGGLLVGAVANMRPELFRAVVAQVPFVDVVTTMLDETIPLTVPEFEEWGNPKDPEYYTYMKSYSPYDNVSAQDYPAMLVTTGINDTRVAFWEPAKWVAKLRTTKTDSNSLVLKTQLGAGHGGPSGRYNAWREIAFVYAFVLSSVGTEQ